jgi:hypothetical protein
MVEVEVDVGSRFGDKQATRRRGWWWWVTRDFGETSSDAEIYLRLAINLSVNFITNK